VGDWLNMVYGGRRFNATRDSKLARWMVSGKTVRQYQEIVRDALQDQRFEMLKALEVGQPPVDRREYWIHRMQ